LGGQNLSATASDPGDLQRAFHELERGGIGNLRDTELLRHLRRYLGRVSIDGLHAGDDEVVAVAVEELRLDLANRLGQRIGGSRGVGSSKLAVGEQDGMVGADRECVLKHLSGERWSHGQGDDLAVLLLPQSSGERQGLLVQFVADGIEHASFQCALLPVPRVRWDVLDVGHLFDQDYVVHVSLSFLGKGESEHVASDRWATRPTLPAGTRGACGDTDEAPVEVICLMTEGLRASAWGVTAGALAS
jgi:hypothetical protein